MKRRNRTLFVFSTVAVVGISNFFITVFVHEIWSCQENIKNLPQTLEANQVTSQYLYKAEENATSRKRQPEQHIKKLKSLIKTEYGMASTQMIKRKSASKNKQQLFTINHPGIFQQNNFSNGSRRDRLEIKKHAPWIENMTNKVVYYPPFQPEVTSDFPTVEGREPRIPHIIHQTFTDSMVPSMYSGFAQKLASMHVTWKYFFWTDDSARKLISEEYPHLLPVWDRYDKSIKKGDVIRYVVLYHFGGAYVDMDVDSLRPLDRVTMKYACIIPTEPFEHSVFLYKTQILLSNAVMFCRPKHPFFKFLLDNLHQTMLAEHVVLSTGPGFVTQMFLIYNGIDKDAETNAFRMKVDNSSNSPYFYRGTWQETHNDAVYVPNTRYFLDDVDVKVCKESFIKTCASASLQPFLVQRACKEMERRGLQRKPEDQKFKFIKHLWFHFWNMDDNMKSRFRKVNITSKIPNCIIY